MTSPPDPAAARLAALTTTVTAQRGQITRLNNILKDLTAQVAALTQTVTDTLATAAPKGRSAVRWDTLDQAGYARELDKLRRWVDHILTPLYVTGGPWTLPDCWDQHPYAVTVLSTLSEQWRQIWERQPPGPVKDALEFEGLHLPNVLTRVANAARDYNHTHTGPP